MESFPTMSHAKFVHLHVHSAYSLSEGAIKIPQLVSLCEQEAMPAVAVTDTGNLFGALEFSLAARRAWRTADYRMPDRRGAAIRYGRLSGTARARAKAGFR